MPKPYRIRCTFRPQAWVRDYAIEVDPQGDTTWDTTVATFPFDSYDKDRLREAPEAPAWVLDWRGPYEIEVVIVNDANDTLDQIAALLSGREWTSDTLDQVAEVLRCAGRRIDDRAAHSSDECGPGEPCQRCLDREKEIRA